MAPPDGAPGEPGDVDALLEDRTAVVFDMDGTLLTLDAPWKRLRQELASFLEPEVTPTGPDRPASETLRALRAQGRDGDVERVLEHLRQAELEGVEGSTPVPAGIDLLERAREAGLALAVVSNNCQATVERALDHHGLREAFDVVVGLGETEDLKPEPDGLLAVLDDLGVAPDEALFVGNDWKDFQAGEAAGVATLDVATLRRRDG